MKKTLASVVLIAGIAIGAPASAQAYTPPGTGTPTAHAPYSWDFTSTKPTVNPLLKKCRSTVYRTKICRNVLIAPKVRFIPSTLPLFRSYTRG